MKNKFADLHIHSSFSDGVFSPREILDKAKGEEISCIAITDHDCVDAIPYALKESSSSSIEIVPAVELTAEFDDTEVHILGYFIDYQEENFVNKLREICRAREERMDKMVEKLNSFGIKIDYREIMETKGEGSVGRLHLAQMLLKYGYVKDIAEAFQKYIGNHAPCYVNRFRILPFEAIRMIQRVKGIPVLAHPYKMNRDELIKYLIKEGIEGIEVEHPEHPPSVVSHYLFLAEKYGLLKTGGSDCHGLGRGKRTLGRRKIPYLWVEEMKRRRKRR